jgi:hypothetical protein
MKGRGIGRAMTNDKSPRPKGQNPNMKGQGQSVLGARGEVLGIELEGWTLRDEQAHVFTFPGYVMGPEEVWMGRQGEGGRWQVVDSRRERRSRGWAWARGWASNG